MASTLSPSGSGSGPLTSTVCPECKTWIAPGASHCSTCGYNPDGAPVAMEYSSALDDAELATASQPKQLNIAQRILLVVGLVSMFINFQQLMSVESAVTRSMSAQAAKLTNQGKRIDPVKFEAIKKSAVQRGQLLAAGFIAVGGLYLALAFALPKFPVPIACAALAVYIMMTVIMWMVDPITAAARLIFRIIIIVALAKAVIAAVTYQGQLNQARRLDAGFSS